MRLTVLGSSGMFATELRAASGYLVEFDSTRLWMDAGAGTWRNLLQSIPYEQLDGVILTHRHPDHVTDVFQAHHARQYGAPEPLPPIPLWAPEETLERVIGYSQEITESFDLHVVAGGESMDFGGARISFFSMAHSAQTVGVRIDHRGGIVAYSADTGPEADFDGLAGQADVFLCEATLQDSDPEWGGHMRASQAGAVAAGSGALKLLLTHLPSGRDLGLSLAQAHESAKGVEVQLADDGQRLEIER